MQTTVGTGVRFPPLKLKYRYVRFELMEVKKIGIQLFTEFPIFVNPYFHPQPSTYSLSEGNGYGLNTQ